MRQVGSLSSEADAHRFAAYLVTQGVEAHAEEDGDAWAIWVRDENDMEAGAVIAPTAVAATPVVFKKFRRDTALSLIPNISCFSVGETLAIYGEGPGSPRRASKPGRKLL